jgi:hypothetical protein
MNLFYFFFTIVNSEFIKNANINPCRNCIHYKPNYPTSLSKCNNFGVKNIIDNTINYEYAENCRTDESKCGLEGKYFEKDDFVDLKMIKNNIMNNYFYISLSFILFLYCYSLTIIDNN